MNGKAVSKISVPAGGGLRPGQLESTADEAGPAFSGSGECRWGEGGQEPASSGWGAVVGRGEGGMEGAGSIASAEATAVVLLVGVGGGGVVLAGVGGGGIVPAAGVRVGMGLGFHREISSSARGS